MDWTTTDTDPDWPALAVDAWRPTRETLHMWLQIVGKIRMVCSPPQNHYWHCALQPTARGLTTGPLTFEGVRFAIELDLIRHRATVVGTEHDRGFDLVPMTVADFHDRLFSLLREAGVSPRIHGAPNEVAEAIPFALDTVHSAYDPNAARLFQQQLSQAYRLLSIHRAEFDGKASPVHFFWGAMDLACTRFSGRTAPMHPGGVDNCPDHVMVDSYSHELASAGFWPGGGREGAFYAYAYPAPEGYTTADGLPSEAHYSAELGEYLLPYENVRTADDPDDVVLRFLRATSEAAAGRGDWAGAIPR